MSFRNPMAPLYIPDQGGMPGAPISWIKTPPAARGSAQRTIQGLASGPGTSIAQLELDQDVCQGEAIAACIQVEVNSITQGGVTPGVVQWTLRWGYGGVQFSRTLFAQRGRYVVVGDWFRVDCAFINNAPITPTATPDGTANVSASISPATDGQTRWGTTWDGYNTGLSGPSGGLLSPTFVGADRYQLFKGPCSLWRVNGYNYGPNLDYVMLFDVTTLAGSGVPNGVCGAVPANGTFSLDVSLSGRDYQNGIFIAASSTGGTYTRDAAALLAVDVELLEN